MVKITTADTVLYNLNMNTVSNYAVMQKCFISKVKCNI